MFRGWAGVAGPDVQGRGEGVVADVRCVVTGAAGSREQRDAAGDQASGCYIIVDAGDAGDGNLQSVEELLATRYGAPGDNVLAESARPRLQLRRARR